MLPVVQPNRLAENRTWDFDAINGTLRASTPLVDLDVTNKLYVDTGLALKLNSGDFSTQFALSLAAIDTDDVAEGVTNLYFTSARARGALSGTAPITFNAGTGAIGFDGSTLDHNALNNLATGDVHTQYYNLARLNTWLAGKTTDNLTEGAANLYWSNTLWDARFAVKTTSDLPEGTNLYFTTARARASISGAGAISYNNTTGVISVTPGVGLGDVLGPAGAINNNFATFDGVTGKIIKDSGLSSASFLKIDQTTPQTIINGVPLMTTAVDPYGSDNQLVNMDYVKSGTWLMPPIIEWYDPVAEGGLPAAPSVGDRYGADSTGFGWTIDYIYEWDGSVWVESAPEEGWMLWDLFGLIMWVFFSGGWMEEGEDSFLKLDQTIPQIFTGGVVTGSGLLKVTAGILGLDTNTYLTAVTAHNLLSATHGDTLTDTVVRGDIIVGNLTPKWARLAFPATPTGKVLIATATDVAWSANPLGTAAYAATGDFLAIDGKAADSDLLDNHDTAYFQVALTFGIADTNKVQINAVDVAENDYALFTATGLKGRSYAEVLSDIGASPVASPTFTGTVASPAYEVSSTSGLKVTAAAATYLFLSGTVANGASAVGTVLDNSTSLSTAGAKITSFRNATVEKAYVDYAGLGYFAGGLQMPNNTWLKATNNAGSGTVNILSVNTSDEIVFGATVNLGTIAITADSGAVTLVDMPVSATPTDGTEESYSFAIDAANILKIYAEADHAGNIKNKGIYLYGNMNVATQATSISILDNSATSLVIKEGANSYLTFDSSNGTENITAAKRIVASGGLDGTIGATTPAAGTFTTIVGDSINLGDTVLSDYKESTFAPTVTLVGGAGNTVPVYTTNTGRYTRIGNRVFVDIELTGDGGAEGAGTGAFNIALPITVFASAANKLIQCGHVSNGASIYGILGYITVSATTVELYYINGTALTGVTGALQNDASRLVRLSFWYEV